MVFLESVAGVSPQERITDSQLYNVLYQEVLVGGFAVQPSKASAQSSHSRARSPGTTGRLPPDASLLSGFRLVAPDPELGPTQVLGS